MGGMVAAIEQGYPQREIAESAYRAQQAVDAGRAVVVGVNDYSWPSSDTLPPILYIDDTVGDMQLARAWPPSRRRATMRASTASLAALQDRRAWRRSADGADPRRRARVRDGRRDVRRARDVWGEYEERTEF